MRLIGIDHGMARIGVAVSDHSGLIARELAIITRTSKREDFAKLNAIAAEHQARAFVVGIPSDFDAPDDVDYTQADRVRTWVERFKAATALPITSGTSSSRPSMLMTSLIASSDHRAPTSMTSPPA